jgi:uncharacterized cupredoxin-like copper-binding protein
MTTHLRRFAAFALLGAGLLTLLAACGPQTVNVGESEDFKMTLSTNTGSAGKITFHVTNNATDTVHEFVVVKSDLAEGALPVDADGNVDEDQINHLDEVEDIQPGESQDFTMELQPGNYVLMCNLPDHYKQGMHASFTVK